MYRYKIPSLFKFNNARDFFVEFINLNNSKKNFSQRGLSQKLNWPASYLPDLIQKRKKFTINRAVQFGQKFELDPIDFEKLIYLAILDMKILEQPDVDKLKNTKNKDRHKPTQDFDLLDAKLFLVLECIKWLKGTATLEKIKELTERQGLSEIEISEYIKILTRKKFIRLYKNEYSVLVDGIKSDDPNSEGVIHLHTMFSIFFQLFMTNPIGPAIYNSSIVHLDCEKFNDLADKLITIRNWILEHAKKDGDMDFKHDVRLFQLDINLVPIFSKQIAHKYRPRKGD